MADIKRASALSYQDGDVAPSVVAKGQGKIAERIVEIAEQAGVPIREDPILLEALERLDVGQQINPELYGAVAELLVWAWRTDQRAGRKLPRT